MHELAVGIPETLAADLRSDDPGGWRAVETRHALPGLAMRYGLLGPGGLGVLTPYAGLGLAAEDSRTFRAGARWRFSAATRLNLEATRSEAGTGQAPDHGVALGLESRW